MMNRCDEYMKQEQLIISRVSKCSLFCLTFRPCFQKQWLPNMRNNRHKKANQKCIEVIQWDFIGKYCFRAFSGKVRLSNKVRVRKNQLQFFKVIFQKIQIFFLNFRELFKAFGAFLNFLWFSKIFENFFTKIKQKKIQSNIKKCSVVLENPRKY